MKMSIFDIFNFKKDFSAIFTPENFALLRAVAIEHIKKQAKEKAKAGEEKMDAVIEAVVEFLHKHIHSKNTIVQWIIDNILIKNIRLVIQSIYDDLKAVIRGL